MPFAHESLTLPPATLTEYMGLAGDTWKFAAVTVPDANVARFTDRFASATFEMSTVTTSFAPTERWARQMPRRTT